MEVKRKIEEEERKKREEEERRLQVGDQSSSRWTRSQQSSGPGPHSADDEGSGTGSCWFYL